MTTTRQPVVAGQFYSGTKQALEQELKQCFTSARGCGKIPAEREEDASIKGLVVPHAGYLYSGAIASHAYCALAKHGVADTYILLGPNHTGIGSGISLMAKGSWQTPLGDISIDHTMTAQLQKDLIDDDPIGHQNEHSIEVQLPFLQYIHKDTPFQFVPISFLMQDQTTAHEIGLLLATVIQNSSKNVVIIASTDFSHVGFNYRTMPPEGLRVDTYAQKQDKLALDAILQLNPDRLIQTVEDHAISMCGYGPVAAMLYATKKLGATKAELLKYGTSYEIQPSSSCVGYAALKIY